MLPEPTRSNAHGREQHAVVFLLLCASESCARFKSELAAHRHASAVEHFEDASTLLRRLVGMRPGVPAVVLLDTASPEAWDALHALKATPLRHVPVVVLSDDDRVAGAYDQLVNAVLPRETWVHDMSEVARAFGAFWVSLVRLPAVNEHARPAAPVRGDA